MARVNRGVGVLFGVVIGGVMLMLMLGNGIYDVPMEQGRETSSTPRVQTTTPTGRSTNKAEAVHVATAVVQSTRHRAPESMQPVAESDNSGAANAAKKKDPLADNGAASSVEASSGVDVALDTEIKGKFTVAMLTYKAPLSLSASIASFAEHGLFDHPQFHELVVYFQVFRETADRDLVKHLLAKINKKRADSGEAAVRYRVVGSPQNLPVARATFKLIRQLETEYVLYLECDRPIHPRPGVAKLTRALVTQGLEVLGSGMGDLFRMQQYSKDGVDQRLPYDTYGTDTFKKCMRAPSLTKEYCRENKKSLGPVFYAAYCKHWWKFSVAKEQVDLCDGFCFRTWMDHFSASLGFEKFTKMSNISASSSDVRHVYCMKSSSCNWTNQPTLYKKSWYFKAMIEPCEANPGKCIGGPGRISAVRQEVFFLNPQHWASKQWNICVSEGLFVHQEVDNREPGAGKR